MAQKTEREKLADETVETFFRGKSSGIPSDIVSDIITKAIERANKGETTDKQMVVEIYSQLQREQQAADKKRRKRIGGPEGSESTEAMGYRLRKWYAVYMRSGDTINSFYITFTKKELKEFREGDREKRLAMIAKKAEPGRREAFTFDDRDASKLISAQLASKRGISSLEIDPNPHERIEGGMVPVKRDEPGRGTLAERQAQEAERVATVLTMQRCAFTIRTRDSDLIRVSARLSDKELEIWSRAKKGGEKALAAMEELVAQLSIRPGSKVSLDGGATSITKKQEVKEILFSAAVVGLASVKPASYKPKKGVPRKVPPKRGKKAPERMASQAPKSQTAEKAEEVFRYSFVLTTKQGEELRIAAPLTIDEVSAIERNSPNEMYGVVYNLMERGGAIVDGKEGKEASQKLYSILEAGIAKAEPSDLLESEQSRLAAAEIEEKGTTISVAIRLNKPVDARHPAEGNKPGDTFTYQNVVLTFTPTGAELEAYNQDPQGFKHMMAALLEDLNTRKDFLKIHRRDEYFVLFVPPAGTKGPKKYWGDGGLEEGYMVDDPAVARYLLGYYDTHGENYPNGFKVQETALTTRKRDGEPVTQADHSSQIDEAFEFQKQEKPKAKPSYYMVHAKDPSGTKKFYVSLMPDEAKRFRRAPRQILYQKASAGEVYSQGKISKSGMNSLRAAIGSPSSRFVLFKKAKRGEGLQKLAIWGGTSETSPYIESPERRIAAAERDSKSTNIAIAMTVGKMQEYVRLDRNKSEYITFDRFVFMFQPTADEMRAYNENPSQFNTYLNAVLADTKRREALLEKHKGKVSMYIPSDGYVMASYDFWQKYPGGVVIRGNTNEGDMKIRLGIMGSNLISGLTGGYTIRGMTSVSTGGGTAQTVREIRRVLPLPVKGRKPPRRPRVTSGGKVTSIKVKPYVLSFTSGGEKITVTMNLGEKEARAISKRLAEDENAIYDILREKLKRNSINIVRTDGKYIFEREAAVLDYLERGISTSKGVALRRQPSKKRGTEVTGAPES
jgi:hypothetical protein